MNELHRKNEILLQFGEIRYIKKHCKLLTNIA